MKKAELLVLIDEQEAAIMRAHTQLQRMSSHLEAEKTHWQRICDEHNAITHMLDEVFGFQVGAKDFEGDDPLWDVKDKASGVILVHHQKDIAEAYRRAILQRYQPED